MSSGCSAWDSSGDGRGGRPDHSGRPGPARPERGRPGHPRIPEVGCSYAAVRSDRYGGPRQSGGRATTRDNTTAGDSERGWDGAQVDGGDPTGIRAAACSAARSTATTTAAITAWSVNPTRNSRLWSRSATDSSAKTRSAVSMAPKSAICAIATDRTSLERDTDRISRRRVPHRWWSPHQNAPMTARVPATPPSAATWCQPWPVPAMSSARRAPPGTTIT